MAEIGVILLVCSAGFAYVWMMLRRLGVGGKPDCGCGSGKVCQGSAPEEAKNAANRDVVTSLALWLRNDLYVIPGTNPKGAPAMKSGTAFEPASLDKHFGSATFRRDPKGESQ